MDSRTNVAKKCTLCSHLTDRGEPANCVTNCPGKARMIGDLDDENSDVARYIKDAGKNVYKLPDSGNSPVGVYVLRKVKWQE
jgi:molybdopterin-containing oxidoreductase family iron-sulfur binding subunit